MVVGTTGWHADITTIRAEVETQETGFVYGVQFLHRHESFFRRWCNRRCRRCSTSTAGHIFERHHAQKKDAPSGTAMIIQRSSAEASPIWRSGDHFLPRRRSGRHARSRADSPMTRFISAMMPNPGADSRKARCAQPNGSPASKASSISRMSGEENCRPPRCPVFPIDLSADSRYLILMQLRGCGTALVTPFHQDGSHRRAGSAQPCLVADRFGHRFSGSLRHDGRNSDAHPRRVAAGHRH